MEILNERTTNEVYTMYDRGLNSPVPALQPDSRSQMTFDLSNDSFELQWVSYLTFSLCA